MRPREADVLPEKQLGKLCKRRWNILSLAPETEFLHESID
jgi:hypothetical protein